MRKPLKSWYAPDPHQAAQLLRRQVGMTQEIAESLVRQVEQSGPVEFVAALTIHTETTPVGQHAGAGRWQLSIDTAGESTGFGKAWQLDKLERDVQPRTAAHSGRRT